MAFDITKFRSSFSKSGEPANPTNYFVEFTGFPPSLLAYQSAGVRNFPNFDTKHRAEAVSIPDQSFATIDRKTYGIQERIVTSKSLQPVTVSFIVSDNMEEFEFIRIWSNLILSTSVPNEGNGNISNNINYYDNYVGKLTISQHNKSGKLAYTHVLVDAYPISITEIPLSWNSNNDYIRMNVVFQYKNIISKIVN